MKEPIILVYSEDDNHAQIVAKGTSPMMIRCVAANLVIEGIVAENESHDAKMMRLAAFFMSVMAMMKIEREEQIAIIESVLAILKIRRR